jgi:hypothetical protein
MSFESLPVEIIHNIFSHSAGNYKDLWSFSLVCRQLREVATSFLYANIELQAKDEWVQGKEWRFINEDEKIIKTLALYVPTSILWEVLY